MQHQAKFATKTILKSKPCYKNCPRSLVILAKKKTSLTTLGRSLQESLFLEMYVINSF